MTQRRMLRQPCVHIGQTKKNEQKNEQKKKREKSFLLEKIGNLFLQFKTKVLRYLRKQVFFGKRRTTKQNI